MEKERDRWEALTEFTHPADDHSQWGASQVEAGHLYEAGSPHRWAMLRLLKEYFRSEHRAQELRVLVGKQNLDSTNEN